MNIQIKITNLTDYINHINKKTEPGVSYIYRCQKNTDWTVSSSAYRRVIEDQQPDTAPDFLADFFVRHLIQIINEIQLKYPATYRHLTSLECMAHLQHNKVATGLIDFTFNPLVALYFACDIYEDKDGIVFVLENNSEKIVEITSKEDLNKNLVELFNVEQPQWNLWQPTLDNVAVDTQRMTIQQSVFLFGLPEVTAEMNIHEILITHQNKAHIRAELDNLGISEISLFSDLIGFFERNTHAHSYDLSLIEHIRRNQQ